MNTGTAIVVLVVSLLLLGLGLFAIIMAGRALFGGGDPDVRVSSGGLEARAGKTGLLVFIVLGILLVIGGVGLLVTGIRGLT